MKWFVFYSCLVFLIILGCVDVYLEMKIYRLVRAQEFCSVPRQSVYLGVIICFMLLSCVGVSYSLFGM